MDENDIDKTKPEQEWKSNIVDLHKMLFAVLLKIKFCYYLRLDVGHLLRFLRDQNKSFIWIQTSYS